MLTFAVFVAFCQAEVDDVDVITGRVGATNQEVVRFDVSMDDSLFVNFLDAPDELACDHQHGLEVKIALAGLEEVLKRGPK